MAKGLSPNNHITGLAALGRWSGLFNAEDLVGLAARGLGEKLVPSARFV